MALGATPIREHLTVHLCHRQGVVVEVELSASRVVQAARVLRGKPIDEALALIPLLFALCGRAQAEAASSAIEQAAGFEVSPAERAARDLLVLSEVVEEHLRSVLVEWPKALGLSPDLDRYRQARQSIRRIPQLLEPAGFRLRATGRRVAPNVPELQAVGAHVTALVADALVDVGAPMATSSGRPERTEPPQGASSPRGASPPRGALPPQAASSPRARAAGLGVLSAIVERGLSAVGAGPVRLAADLDLLHLEAALRGDPGFGQKPTDRAGQPSEVGPFARHASHPAVAAARAEHGDGVHARLIARLVDLDAARAGLCAALDRLLEAGPSAADAHVLAAATGVGLGVARTARGPLVHRVVLDRGRVAAFSTVAPTEWNLHPEGAIQNLLGLAGSDPRLSAAGRTYLVALDPCVAFDVEVRSMA